MLVYDILHNFFIYNKYHSNYANIFIIKLIIL